MTRNINMLYLLSKHPKHASSQAIRYIHDARHKEHLNSLHVCVLYAAVIFRFS